MKRLAAAVSAGVLIGQAADSAAEPHGYRYQAGSASSYCTGSVTASGQTPEWGVVAHNGLPFGTWVEVVGPRSAVRALGRRYFQVADRGRAGYFLIDLWTRRDCGWSYFAWGRRRVAIRVIPRHHIWRGLPAGGWRWVP